MTAPNRSGNELRLVRFWLVSNRDSARIELSDGVQTLCTLDRDGDVSAECPDDDRRMLSLAIQHGETNDARWAGTDRDETAAWVEIDAADARWEAAHGGRAA